MRQNTIRCLDKILGSIICYLLTLHRYFFTLFKKNINRKKYSKILFIKLVEQGSIILAYPAVKRAIDLVGKENVYFLTFKENFCVLEVLDILYPYNIIQIDSKNLIKLTISVFSAISKIRKENIDVCIDMEFFSRFSAILSYLSGAETRVGLHRFNLEGLYRGDLFTHKLSYNPYLHTRIFFLSLIDALKYPPNKKEPLKFFPSDDKSLPKFLPSNEELKSFEEKLKKKIILNRPIIILNPNTSDILPLRRWPLQNFIRLGNLIKKEYPNSTIIITGRKEEKKISFYLASKIDKAFSLAGETTLRELLLLYSLSDILITNDSGPAHFSILTPLKTIVLFGPETPLLYGYNQNNRVELYSQLICSPCMSVYNQKLSGCKVNLCLINISPEEVFKKVKELLK